MTAPRDPDSILSAWLDEGPSRLPSSTRRAILTSTQVTKQERHLKWMPWRISMQAMTRVAVAAIVLIAVVGGRYGLLQLRPCWPAFTHPQPGPRHLDLDDLHLGSLRLQHRPPGRLDRASCRPHLDAGRGRPIGCHSLGGLHRAGRRFSRRPGRWPSTRARRRCVDLRLLPAEPATPCDPLSDRDIAVTVDGHPGSLVQFDEDTQAFILVGDRMYVVAVWEPDSDPEPRPTGAPSGSSKASSRPCTCFPAEPVARHVALEDLHLRSLRLQHRPPGRLERAARRPHVDDGRCDGHPVQLGHGALPLAGRRGWRVGLVGCRRPGNDRGRVDPSYCQLLENDFALRRSRAADHAGDRGGPPWLAREVRRDTQAFILVGDRMYVVAVWRSDQDPSTATYGGAQHLLEAYLSTMTLLPSGSAVPVGSLEPGSYTDGGVDGSSFNVAFIVPAGWSWDGRTLTKSAGNRSVAASISFYAGPVDVYADPCHWSGASSATSDQQASVNAVMDALVGQLSRNASQPVDRNADVPTVAGRWAGKAVNLTVPAELDLSSCDQGQFRSWGPDARVRVNDGAGEHDLVWAVDLQGNGVNVPGEMLIIDAGTFPDTPPDVLAEVDSILASIKTGHWG